jgi:hypothetical protein
VENAVSNTKDSPDHFQRITRQGKRSCTGLNYDVAGIGVLYLDASVGRTATLSHLQEYADFAVKQRKPWLFNRANRADQTNERDSARIARIGLNVFADDQIPDCRD